MKRRTLLKLMGSAMPASCLPAALFAEEKPKSAVSAPSNCQAFGYGMGLQGWDASFIFQNDDPGEFKRALGDFDVAVPNVLGLFPAIARQILRGDVRESEVVAVRNVHAPSVFQGKLGFDDKVKQGYDEKELDSSKVPAQVLSVSNLNHCKHVRRGLVHSHQP